MVEMCPSSTVTSTYLLQITWDEIGESYNDRDKMLLELEQECLHIYNKMFEEIPKYRAQLQRSLAQAQAEIASVMHALGEKISFPRKGGSLKEQISTVNPVSEDLLMKKDLQRKELSETLTQIAEISSNIAGNDYPVTSGPEIDESDLTQRKLDELRAHLHDLRNEKAVRLQKVNSYISAVHDLSEIMSFDSSKALSSVHSSLTELSKTHSKSISNDTLARLTELVKSLKEEKHERLIKLQGLGRSMQELWNIMETPMDERRRFDHCSDLLSGPADDSLKKGCLGLDIILEAVDEVKRLNALKSSKMKEMVFKRQCELEEIYRGNHMDINSDAARKSLVNLIESDGTKDDPGLLVSSSTAFKLVRPPQLEHLPMDVDHKVNKSVSISSSPSVSISPLLAREDYEAENQQTVNSKYGEAAGGSMMSTISADYYLPFSSNRSAPMEACQDTESMSSFLYSRRKPRRLLLGSSRHDRDIPDNPESEKSDTESQYDDSSSEDEDEEAVIMKGVRRSVVFSRLSPELRSQLKGKLSETITHETAEVVLGNQRFQYVLDTNPKGDLHFSDNEGILMVFYGTHQLPAEFLLSEEPRNRLKHALGWIHDQDNHDDCWTYTSSDLISASRVLHGWEERYKPLSAAYLLQKVDPNKYAIPHTRSDGSVHHCYADDIECALVYVKKFGIPRERRVRGEKPSCTRKWIPIPGEKMVKITHIYMYQTLPQALKRLRTHPVAATLFAFEGTFGSEINHGLLKEGGAKFLGYHGVIIRDCRIIDGVMVAICKSSSGEDIGLEGDKGCIAVSLETMFLFAGVKRTEDNEDNRSCNIRPHYLLTNFYSIDMEYKNPDTEKEDKEAAENEIYEINEEQYDWMESPFESNKRKRANKRKRGNKLRKGAAKNTAANKDSVKKKPISSSARAGIQCPVGRIHGQLKQRVSEHESIGATAKNLHSINCRSSRVSSKCEQGSESEEDITKAFAACKTEEMGSLTLSSKE